MQRNCCTCKHHTNCEMWDCYAGDPPTRWEAADDYVPDTKADYIRAMSDDELANWIDYEFMRCDWCKPDRIGTDDCSDISCTNCIRNWLKEPAEE